LNVASVTCYAVTLSTKTATINACGLVYACRFETQSSCSV